MLKEILVFGNGEQFSAECNEPLFNSSGYTLRYVPSPAAIGAITKADLPIAVLSCYPCDVLILLELFASLPIGTGERIPFFQRVDSIIPDFVRDLPVAGFFEVPQSNATVASIIKSIERNRSLLEQQLNLQEHLEIARAELDHLVAIGTALSSEHDLQKLLRLLLATCRASVCADAGSIYVRERSVPGGPFTDSLMFMVAQNDSINPDRNLHYRLPINAESIAGYVASTGKPLVIDDVGAIDQKAPFRLSNSFQDYFGYRTKSMLTVPLMNLAHEVVGVLQLINRKASAEDSLRDASLIDARVVPFTTHDERFVLSVAQLAAVSLERAELHENVTALLEGFLNASVASIDERDRVTSGHSRRVMRYAMAFVDAAERLPEHPFHELCKPAERRRQFQFAALLHDIGKIGVPEFVLTKEQRLPRDEFNLLMANLDFIGIQQAVQPDTVEWASPEELLADREFLIRVNDSGRIDEADRDHLKMLGKKVFTDLRGNEVPLLSAYANEALSLPRGNLTALERELINSHAQSTRRILSMIPWTSNLMHVPEIAAQHHERIDGSGYPQGITGDKMFLESKILAVIDIYEALVSQDRPYKPKLTPETAVEILRCEAADAHLDTEVVEFFVGQGIYRLYCRDEQECA